MESLGQLAAGVLMLLIGGTLLALSGSWVLQVKRREITPRITEIELEKNKVSSSYIELRRPTGTADDFVQSYYVRIDGSVVGRLKIGEILRVRLRTGPHVLKASMSSGSGTAPLHVKLEEGLVLYFDIEPTPGSLPERRRGQWLQIVETASRKPSA